MDVRSKSRNKSPLRPSTHSRTSSQTSVPRAGDDSPTLSFGTASQLIAVTTPPTARIIPPQTPSYSLAGRTKETLRLAKERQLASARRTPRPPTSTKATNNATFSRNNSQSSVSVSRPRVQTISTFNPSRSRPNTPISSIHASTPTTPLSPRRMQQVGNISSTTSSPKTTPTSVRTTSAGSSMAVRDAIKKAKEAHKQKTNTPPSRARRIDYNDERSFDEIDNPFNTSPGTPPLQAQLRRAIENGRTTGNLNISNLELIEIPDEVYSMYDLSTKTVVVDFSSRSSGWYESVDLQRFNAAGNEISSIDRLDQLLTEEFAGIKHFDMHSNKLSALPTKFISLAFLRTLNLSKNKLSIGVFDTISHIPTLIEVYLAHNELEGPLPPSVTALKELQILDLEGNKISSLPETFDKLRRMRILLFGDNHLESIPWKALEHFRDLFELDVSSNNLSGDLVSSDIDKITLSALSNLDVHSNNLEALPSNLHLPSLTQFNATQNSLVTTGTFFTATPRLVHLSVAQNQLSILPDGIIHLAYLRSLDISNNVIEHIDPRLGLLDRLTTFMWMGNLIRMRAWGSMDTEGIKSALRAKADEAALKALDEDMGELSVKACRGECAGTLNLTGKLKESPLTEETISEHVHASHFPVLSKIILQQNKLTVTPMQVSAVATLTTLDLSKNYLTSVLFDQPVVFDNLIHLDLSVNKIDSLDQLPSVLSAPTLKILDVSFNSLTSLIPLHTHYPRLSTLHVNSNQLTSVTPNDFEGLEVVQINNNSINKLPPELGLVESLRVLGVEGNTFRVPGRRIVEAGSAALLEWLRNRCVVPS